MKERTPVSAYKLPSSSYNKQRVYINSLWTPCMITGSGETWQTPNSNTWSKYDHPGTSYPALSGTWPTPATWATLPYSMIQPSVRANYSQANSLLFIVFTKIWFYTKLYLVMDHHYKSLLLNMPVRHIINKLKTSSSELKQQLIRLDTMKIKNFFILGRYLT